MRTILKILIMLFGVVSYAQTTVTGTITDQSDQPLSGATVIVVGTSTGVVADFDDIINPFNLVEVDVNRESIIPSFGFSIDF